jgi:predicted nucleic acid-binding protein
VLAIVDTGPLYAVVDADDEHHQSCVDVLVRPDLQLVVPALVVGEVSYLVGKRLGSRHEAMFLHGLSEMDVELPEPEDWQRIGALVRQYADFPLGGTDASVVALAERLDTDIVVTLDTRHFAAVRPRHTASLSLLPE